MNIETQILSEIEKHKDQLNRLDFGEVVLVVKHGHIECTHINFTYKIPEKVIDKARV